MAELPYYEAYEVLEQMRDEFDAAGLKDEADVLNEAHYLIQEHERSNSIPQVL